MRARVSLQPRRCSQHISTLSRRDRRVQQTKYGLKRGPHELNLRKPNRPSHKSGNSKARTGSEWSRRRQFKVMPAEEMIHGANGGVAEEAAEAAAGVEIRRARPWRRALRKRIRREPRNPPLP
jgi:hypothetical protein